MLTKFLRVLMRSMNADPGLLSQPGVSVIGHPSRADSHVTAGYLMGEHFVVTCDPAAESMLIDAVVEMEPTMAAWRTVAASVGGELLGAGRMQLLPDALPQVGPLPDGFSFRRLNANAASDLALITDLVERSDEEDLDEAEIYLDDLDEIIQVVVDASGRIATYSAACPFEMAVDYADIGILTRPEHRGKNLGSIAVAALCRILRDAGLEPLYRCDDDNVGSVKLSQGLGFEIATQLTAYRFPSQRL